MNLLQIYEKFMINQNKKTNFMIDEKEIGNYITEYKIEQAGGEEPKITITCRSEDLKCLFENLNNIEVKVINDNK